MYYENIFRTLSKFKVRYLVAGGMAVNLYGLPRFTKDLDLLLDESESNLERFGKAMKQLGFKPKIPVISIRDLIKMKEKAGRKQDLSDVKGLKMVDKMYPENS